MQLNSMVQMSSSFHVTQVKVKFLLANVMFTPNTLNCTIQYFKFEISILYFFIRVLPSPVN